MSTARIRSGRRFTIFFNLNLPLWRGWSLADKILSIIIITAILGAIGVMSYVIATPTVEERFTEFYILGLEGKAIDYPRELMVGEGGEVVVGIINREHEVASYQMMVTIDGVKSNQMAPLELAHNEKWEGIVGFTPDRAGDNQKVEFLLYKNGGGEPYLTLYLQINVNEGK